MNADTAEVAGRLEYSIFFECRKNGMVGIAMKGQIDWCRFDCNQEENVFECLGVPWVAEGRGAKRAGAYGSDWWMHTGTLVD